MNVIEMIGVGKKYRRGDRLASRRTPSWALRDISLSVSKGETLGVVGRNGAGKSTLLRLAAGVTAPTVGDVTRRGSVASLLSLGDAFHPLLSGRESAITTAMVAGLTRRAALELMAPVEDFAGLGSAMDDPVRTYSSGMFVRLAFSVAVHIDADTLVIDEVLSVGDLAFSTRCLDLLARRQTEGSTLLIASHDLAQVRRLCDRAIWLDGGVVAASGSTEEVTGSYARMTYGAGRRPGGADAAAKPVSKEVRIGEVRLSTRSSPLDQPLPSGWPLSVEIAWSQEASTEMSATFGVSIHNSEGERCLDLVSPSLDMDGVTDKGRVVLDVDRLDLVSGSYHVDVGIYGPEWSEAFDYRWQDQWFEVIGQGSRGPIAPPHRWRSQ